MDRQALAAEIVRLKKEKQAVLLGHYYAPAEVQDVCDYVGDSLGLSRQAAKTEAKIIVFCGVHFMAETASVLAQDKKVLLPDLAAGCSLAESITGADVAAWREEHPKGVVISYVNTTAEVKAYTDCCCTSANAVEVVEKYKDAPAILFLPDWNLGHYVQRKTGVKMEIWRGACHVHDMFTASRILQALAKYPDAEVLVHPESSGSATPEIADNPRVHIASTTGMIRRAAESACKRFVVVTEPGTLHKMQAAAPGKELIRISDDAECEYMKLATLESVYNALLQEQHEVRVPAALAKKALLSIERMIAIG